MDKREMIHRVAAGLRGLNEEPHAFIFVADMGFCWDENKILEFPVFKNAGFLPPNFGQTIINCPFFPVWKSGGEEQDFYSNNVKFAECFSDHSYE